ncbi:DUF2189 domain-containing protein [Ramlibacter sp. AW1]|uniref:DUF2189 domain-containing protein n=1 Tax=Ramlibacter aurantiacus TaxID=2801330 RepID=A0A936ZQG4_9BURK|nr:DUF2189 domain-containing protein [Ramlibacter aurantiacus]MBL0421593.1 DUF2189 domain-containing protein [Ramlibacter aurantiacus]
MEAPVPPTPVTDARPATARAQVKPVALASPLRWLLLGARDLAAAPGIALFYGLCFWAMAATLGAVFRHSPAYTMTVVSGCLLLGPFLAMGLYEVSRRREQGLPQSLGESLTCWDRRLGSMGLLVLVLVVLELLWGRASLVVFAVFFDTGMPSTAGVLEAVFNPRNWPFVAAYVAVGSVFAGLVFCSMVVAIPMVLDRDTDAITAALTSFRVVSINPVAMGFWGLLVVSLTLLALWPWALGLLVVGPVLGHATWHAYRETVGWAE